MKARTETLLHQEMVRQGRMSKWLAEQVGASESEVSRWRWGVHVPELATRVAIAAALGSEVAELWPPAQDGEAA